MRINAPENTTLAVWVATRCTRVTFPKFIEKANLEIKNVLKRRINQTKISMTAKGNRCLMSYQASLSSTLDMRVWMRRL
jgi:hypothetical protein